MQEKKSLHEKEKEEKHQASKTKSVLNKHEKTDLKQIDNLTPVFKIRAAIKSILGENSPKMNIHTKNKRT